MFTICLKYDHDLTQEPLPLWVTKFTILVDLYYTLSFCKPCLRLEKRLFKEIHQYFIFTKFTSPWGWGVKKFTINFGH